MSISTLKFDKNKFLRSPFSKGVGSSFPEGPHPRIYPLLNLTGLTKTGIEGRFLCTSMGKS